MANIQKNWCPVLNDTIPYPGGIIPQVDTPLLIKDFGRRAESGSYYYGWKWDTDSFFTGGAAVKQYYLYAEGDRSLGNGSTGDSNDAMLRLVHNNYAVCDTNFIMRGINQICRGRSGGLLGYLEGALISVQNDSGHTASTVRAAQFVTRSNASGATEVGGVEIFVSHQAADTPTTFYGLRIRNNDETGNVPVHAAIDIDYASPAKGFNTLIDASGTILTEYDSGTKVCLMYFVGANGTTYYLVHDTDDATAVSVATSLS